MTIVLLLRWQVNDDESNNNEDKICLLLKEDDIGGSHDFRFCSHGITIAFLFSVSSAKQVIDQKLFCN